MKNYFKRIFLPLILSTLGILAALGAEDRNIGVIDDPFFSNPTTVVTIRQLMPHDTKILAVVDGTNEDEFTKTISASPFYTKSWKHRDCDLYSQEEIFATIICGQKVIEKSLLKPTQHPYTFLKNSEHREGELVLGGTMRVYEVKEYQRVDNSIYRRQMNLICTLTMREELVKMPDVSLCYHEWSIMSQWQKKLRHARNHYSCSDVYHVTTSENPSGDKEVTERLFIVHRLVLLSQQAEGPECGSLGRNLPVGYVIQ